MSKLFTKTVSFTFVVEHVSDDPAYEKQLLEAVKSASDQQMIPNFNTRFYNQLVRYGLEQSIVAGGWSAEQYPQAIPDAIYKLRDAIVADINNEWPHGEASGLIQKIEALADEVAEKNK